MLLLAMHFFMLLPTFLGACSSQPPWEEGWEECQQKSPASPNTLRRASKGFKGLHSLQRASKAMGGGTFALGVHLVHCYYFE
jgi:hypothetical protein